MKKIFILMVSAAILSSSAFAAGVPADSKGQGQPPQLNRDNGDKGMKPQNAQKPDKLLNNGIGSLIYKDGGKYGLKSVENGKVLLKPAYEKMDIMGDSHYRIKDGGKWGIMDKSGKVIVSPIYDKVEMYDDGRYFKVRKDGKWGVVDSLGKVLIGVGYTASEITELIRKL